MNKRNAQHLLNNRFGKHKQQSAYTTVSRDRLAALEAQVAGGHDFKTVLMRGFRWGFVFGTLAGGFVSCAAWLLFS